MTPLPRRAFLRGTAAAALCLPWLDAMGAPAAADQPVRLFCVGMHFGFHPDAFFPKQAGPNYALPALLQPLASQRNRFTVFSGLDHPSVGKGHPATVNYLTGVEKPAQRKQHSLDQAAAETIGKRTRLHSLQMAAGRTAGKGGNISWGKGGVALPQQANARELFDQMFGARAKASVSPEAQAALEDRSILDHVLEDAKSLQNKLGAGDRARLDEYLTAVREVENDLAKLKELGYRPADVDVNEAEFATGGQDEVGIFRVMLKLTALAFKTDTTRIATIHCPNNFHALTHHGQKKGKVQSLIATQTKFVKEFATLMEDLATAKDASGPLLDNTLLLLGGGMGNAAIHSTRNLPILLAGGGLKHGSHIKANRPLGDLYVTMLQRMGVETGKFSTSRGNLNELLG
jgi:hypothetical protein